MKFKDFLTSEYEISQMGQPKGKYKYLSQEEYPVIRNILLKKSQERAKKNKVDLDPEMTAYTPGETLKLLNHPKVINWFKTIRTFEIPENYEMVILVPCAATKPWGFSCKNSSFYKAYNEIRRQVQNNEIDSVYFVTISEPLGVIPEIFWGDDLSNMFPLYDNPGLFKDNFLQTGFTKKQWDKTPIGIKREMPYDNVAAVKAIEIIGKEIGAFLKNNASHQFVSFVEYSDSGMSTHSKMLSVAEKVAGITIPRNAKKPQAGRQKQLSKVIAKHIKSTLGF